MSKKRHVLTILAVASLACLAISASAVSSAQAFKWTIEKATLGSGKSEIVSIALEATTTAVLEGKVLGKKIKITATGLASTGAQISQLNNEASDSGALELTGVTVDEPAGCTIKNKKIGTFSLVSEVREVDKVIFDHYAPASGTTLANVEIEGCGQAGTYPLKGAIYSTVGSPGFETISQQQMFSPSTQKAATGTLTLGSEPAELTMNMEIDLTGPNLTKKWGYEE